jgi:c-di-GMP-binding flagellar brake protein YcgR
MFKPDRRVYERVPFFCQVVVAARPGAYATEARTVDISLGGVGVFCAGTLFLRPGSSVSVTFRLADPHQGFCEEVIMGKVANAAADSDGCRYGIEFLDPIKPSTHPRLARAVDRL